MNTKLSLITILMTCIASVSLAAGRVTVRQSATTGAWAVYVNNLPDGFESIDSESCINWAKGQYQVKSFKNSNGVLYSEDEIIVDTKKSACDVVTHDDKNLAGLCGINFGDDAGNTSTQIVLGGDQGLLTKEFTPQKYFDEFTECYCLSTPKTHRICRIYIVDLKSTAFQDPKQIEKALNVKYLSIKPILEKKYKSKCAEWYTWSRTDKDTGIKEETGIEFEFKNGSIKCKIANDKELEDLYGGMGSLLSRAIIIVATDKRLYELGKQEAKEIDATKVSDSVDAL